VCDLQEAPTNPPAHQVYACAACAQRRPIAEYRFRQHRIQPRHAFGQTRDQWRTCWNDATPRRESKTLNSILILQRAKSKPRLITTNCPIILYSLLLGVSPTNIITKVLTIRKVSLILGSISRCTHRIHPRRSLRPCCIPQESREAQAPNPDRLYPPLAGPVTTARRSNRRRRTCQPTQSGRREYRTHRCNLKHYLAVTQPSDTTRIMQTPLARKSANPRSRKHRDSRYCESKLAPLESGAGTVPQGGTRTPRLHACMKLQTPREGQRVHLHTTQ